MKKSKLLSAGAGLAAVLTLTYLYSHGQSRFGGDRQRVHALIAGALQANSSLDANLLQAHNFMLQSYDPVVTNETQLWNACAELQLVSGSFAAAHESALDHKSTEICGYISEKISNAEEFKSKNSVLRNSLLYLQSLTRSKDPHVPKLRYGVLAAALSNYIHANEADTEILRAEIARLAQTKGAASLGHHLKNILEADQEVDRILEQVVSSPTKQALEEFRLKYMEAYEAAENTAAVFRRWLFWSALLLLSAVMYGVVKLVESAKRLHEANEGLENRVTERTRELSASHELILQQQNSLVASTKMSALGEMAGGVAHEINNPLAIIQTVSAQLSELLAEDSIDRTLAQGMADSITRTTERIAKIVQGLRTFSRDGSNDPFHPVPVPALIQDTIVLCQERFRTSGVKLLLEGTEAPMVFSGRSTQISQVLLNLLNNALDAIASDDDRWVRIRTTEEKDHVQILVEDSGTGLTPELQKKLFQPFFTTKEIGKGTGMGLSISLGLIRAHGGTLEAFARPNTCFVIRLPKSHPSSRAA